MPKATAGKSASWSNRLRGLGYAKPALGLLLERLRFALNILWYGAAKSHAKASNAPTLPELVLWDRAGGGENASALFGYLRRAKGHVPFSMKYFDRQGDKFWKATASARVLLSSELSIGTLAKVFKSLPRARSRPRAFVFLQHGVTDISNRSHFRKRHFDLFACSSKLELAYVQRELSRNGGNPEAAKLTGMPRWDVYSSLEAPLKKEHVIVFPTWRSGRATLLRSRSQELTPYFEAWNSLLEWLSETGTSTIFLLHPQIANNYEGFKVPAGIEVAQINGVDFPKLLLNSRCLISDYSSVSLEAIFARVPMISYRDSRDDTYFSSHDGVTREFNLLEEASAHICRSLSCVKSHLASNSELEDLPNSSPELRERIFAGYPASASEMLVKEIGEFLD
jgi:hypothetical protein